jgi:large subunit ribosomal protein L20
MARVKRSVNAKKSHKAIMDRAKGFRGARSRRFRVAKEAVHHAERYAYRDRRAKKGEMRRLWIARINAAARQEGLSYNRLMHGLRLAGVEVARTWRTSRSGMTQRSAPSRSRHGRRWSRSRPERGRRTPGVPTQPAHRGGGGAARCAHAASRGSAPGRGATRLRRGARRWRGRRAVPHT